VRRVIGSVEESHLSVPLAYLRGDADPGMN
jgi:hypothetical protein